MSKDTSNTELKVYVNFDRLPIYNWFRYHQSKDSRHLIIDVDNDDLPELNDEQKKHVSKCITKLLGTYKNPDFRLQRAYYNAVSSLKDYVFSSVKLAKLANKANKLFTNYLKSLNSSYDKFVFDFGEFDNAFNAYDTYKKGKNITDIRLDRLNVFHYVNFIDDKEAVEWDMYNEISLIQKNISINIDEFKCSVTKFNNYKNLLTEMIKERQRQDTLNKAK